MHFPRFSTGARRILIAFTVALAAGLAGPIAASADTAISIPPQSQQDGAWAGAPLGTSPTDTVGSSGCAITSVAMMLNFYGVTVDPGSFNAWLTASGGYAFDDELLWGAVDQFTGGRVRFSAWLGPDLGVIHNEIDYGRPVVAEVSLNGNQHFVLITGYTAAAGLQINDPWFGDAVNFSDRYGDPAAGILSIRTFAPAEAPPSHVAGGPR